MDAPGKVYLNSPLSRRQNPDLERADGRTKDHAAFSPGNAASSVTIANLRPALWSSAPVAIKSTRKDKSPKREELTSRKDKSSKREELTRKKSQIEGSCHVFPGKRCIILVKANFSPVLRNAAPVATKAVRAFQDPVCSSCV